jgi:GDP-4-dehydro-6-deoxy-D-mannose reductase
VRDYISVEDAAHQLVAIVERGESGQVYHVGSGQPVRMHELLARRLAIHGLDFGIVDEHVSLSSRIGYDVPVVYADITRTNALFTQMKNDRI